MVPLVKSEVTNISEYRAKKRKRGSIRWVFVAIFLLACALGGYFFSLSPFFMLQNIEVSGNQQVSDEKIIELSGLELGSNVFSISGGKVIKYLYIDPNIKSAKLIKKYPSSIELEIIEREPAVILPTGRGFAYVADDGVVVYRQQKVSSLSLPILLGVGGFPQGIVAGSSIDSPQLKAGLKIVSQFPENALSVLAEIDVKDIQNITAYTSSGVEVRLGNEENFGVKYNLMLAILEELAKSAKLDSASYIDISIPEKPVIFY